MMMDTYGHLFPNCNRRLVDGLDTVESDGPNATPAQPTYGASQSKVETPSLTPHDIGTNVVRPEGLEPPTSRSVVQHSVMTTDDDQE